MPSKFGKNHMKLDCGLHPSPVWNPLLEPTYIRLFTTSTTFHWLLFIQLFIGMYSLALMHSVSRTLASFNNFALSSHYSHHYLKTYNISSVVFSLSVDKLKAYIHSRNILHHWTSAMWIKLENYIYNWCDTVRSSESLCYILLELYR